MIQDFGSIHSLNFEVAQLLTPHGEMWAEADSIAEPRIVLAARPCNLIGRFETFPEFEEKAG